MERIPSCIPSFTGREREQLEACADSGAIALGGALVERFERAFAAYHGVAGAVAVNSGTAAVHLGLVSLGVGPGDLVLCPSLSFIGAVNAIRYCAADPVFLGVEPETLNLDPACLAEFLAERSDVRGGARVHRATGRRIAAVMLLHLYGTPGRLDRVERLCRDHGVPLLEDAAESLGAWLAGRRVGTVGDVACFSFNTNKMITTGGGGMVLATNEARLLRCKHLRAHAKCDPFEYVHDDIGFNYRLSNLCAAVGLAQLERLDEFVRVKRAHAARYQALFAAGREIEVLAEPDGAFATRWLTIARVRAGGDALARLRDLAAAGIGVRPIWYPAEQLAPYRGAEYFGRAIERDLYSCTFCLPSSVDLSEPQAERVAEQVRRAFQPR